MATHAHTTPDRRPATPPGAGGRRSLFASAAALGLAGAGAAMAASATATPSSGADPLGKLVTSMHRLMVLDRQIDRLVSEADRDLGDSAMGWLCAALDAELTAAAAIRPVCRHGFAVKARIAQQWGELAEGEAVARALLSDLVLRGIAA